MWAGEKMRVARDKELPAEVATPGEFLAVLANSVHEARRADGGRVHDVSDMKEWLSWLQANTKKASTWNEFVRISRLQI